MMILMALLGTVNGILIHRLWMARQRRLNTFTINFTHTYEPRGKYTLDELLEGLTLGGA